MKLAGKVALVTGAASGIGLETIRRFLAEGAKVIAADLAPGRGHPAGDSVLPLRLDVTREDDRSSGIAAAEARFGRLDVLVNNAGLGIPKSLVELTLTDWRAVMAVNLDGVFLGLRAAIPALRRAGGGSIVNVGSVMGVVATVEAAAYCASKGGVAALTRAAALEMAAAGDDIRVNSVSPGFIATPLMEERFASRPERRAALVGSIPVGRLGDPADIAGAIVFLASDDARYVNGADLFVDGAFTIR